MSFMLHSFAPARPYLYHLTSKDNLASIRESARLESVCALLEKAGRRDLVRQRREGHTPIRIGGRDIWLRSQEPLHAGNIDFQDSWKLEDLVACLNELVFFWPGQRHGPIDY